MARYEDALRLDRRLLGRAGWIDPKDLDEALTGLQDAAEKAQTVEEEADEGAPAAPAADPAAASSGGASEA